MTLFRITIDRHTDSAAFENDYGIPDPGPELARILREIAGHLDDATAAGVLDLDRRALFDVNGNTVGRIECE